jgi:hypothetical protein
VPPILFYKLVYKQRPFPPGKGPISLYLQFTVSGFLLR